MTAREGDFMTRWFGASALLLVAAPAFAADVTAVCRLADDKHTVSVAFTNPQARAMQCEVNCDMAIPNGIGTVACAKPVPSGAKDLVLCTEKSEGPSYTRVKGTEVNCRDPDGTPVAPADDKADEDESDATIQKLMKQGQEFIERQKRK
jgi:hypothetical protein